MITKRLANAFKQLRKEGYFARMDWQCCQSCGFAALPEGKEKVVFYHRQDKQYLRDTGKVYLSWAGNGHEIARALEANGMQVEWDGTRTRRILVRGSSTEH